MDIINDASSVLLNAIIYLLNIFVWLIIANALLSWIIPDRTHPLVRFIAQFTEPIIFPFRKISRKIPTGDLPIDISPLLAIISIRIIINILTSLY